MSKQLLDFTRMRNGQQILPAALLFNCIASLQITQEQSESEVEGTESKWRVVTAM